MKDYVMTIDTKKIYIKHFDDCSLEKFQEMHCWCRANLNQEWRWQYPSFYFHDKEDALLFTLRWA